MEIKEVHYSNHGSGIICPGLRGDEVFGQRQVITYPNPLFGGKVTHKSDWEHVGTLDDRDKELMALLPPAGQRQYLHQRFCKVLYYDPCYSHEGSFICAADEDGFIRDAPRMTFSEVRAIAESRSI
jgi:hypothetical protein